MKTCVGGQPFEFQVQMIDDSGASVMTGVASYSISGPGGDVVQNGTANIVDGLIEIIALAASNILAGVEDEARVVFVTSGAVAIFDEYRVQAASFQPLLVPEQSAMTLHRAIVLASEMESVESWLDAPIRQRTTALKAAWIALCGYRYIPFGYGISGGSTARMLSGEYRLNEITEDEWLSTPARFRAAVQRAQMRHAAGLLDGGSLNDLRESGLVSETVGESSRTWREGRAVRTSIHPSAMQELRGYISRGISLCRG